MENMSRIILGQPRKSFPHSFIFIRMMLVFSLRKTPNPTRVDWLRRHARQACEMQDLQPTRDFRYRSLSPTVLAHWIGFMATTTGYPSHARGAEGSRLGKARSTAQNNYNIYSQNPTMALYVAETVAAMCVKLSVPMSSVGLW